MFILKFSNVKEKIGKIKNVKELWEDHNILMQLVDSVAEGLEKYKNTLWTLKEYSSMYNAVEDEADRLRKLHIYYDDEIPYVAWHNRVNLLRKLLQQLDEYNNELSNYFNIKRKSISPDNEESDNEESNSEESVKNEEIMDTDNKTRYIKLFRNI
jgi:hypothetical protein